VQFTKRLKSNYLFLLKVNFFSAAPSGMANFKCFSESMMAGTLLAILPLACSEGGMQFSNDQDSIHFCAGCRACLLVLPGR